jgi:hypothetical protein
MRPVSNSAVRRRMRFAAGADGAQDPVDLFQKGPALAPILEPDEIAGIDARDLPDRPADVASGATPRTA